MAAGDLPADPGERAALMVGAAERATRERRAQGLPDDIEDEATLDAIAAVVRNARRYNRKKGAAA